MLVRWPGWKCFLLSNGKYLWDTAQPRIRFLGGGFNPFELVGAQPPPCCSFARHLVGKIAMFFSFAHH